MPRQILGTAPKGHALSQGVATDPGRMVFIAGQVARDPEGNVVAPGDALGQTRYIFERIRQITQEAGGSLVDVVKLTTYMTDIKYYPIYNTVRLEVFQSKYPASTAVAVTALVDPRFLIEIEAIAVLEGGR